MINTKKMFERIDWYNKKYVYEQYSRIVNKFKHYNSVTRKKMLEEIYDVYSDYHNIINICTERELRYLKMLLDNPNDIENLLDDKYDWERKILQNKFLIENDYKLIFIPNEIKNNVKNAIKNIEWQYVRNNDNINEIMVSYCKIQGSALLYAVVSFASGILGIDENLIVKHAFTNKLFRYYVYVYPKDIETIGNNTYVALYQDYFNIEDELDEERKKQGLAENLPIDLKVFRTLFYNDFDINNIKIKKFLVELKKLPFFWFSVIDIIRDFALLNIDRTPLKDTIKNVPALKNYDLTEFFKNLDDAMDEMPSGALNGFTPNQAKKIKIEIEKYEKERDRQYVKQQNACLSKSDAKLFYKIFFGLLEFTNNKYKIKNKMKIYNKIGINPYELQEIIECFWKNKDTIIPEFLIANPYKFNKEELAITNDFKKGFRGLIIIVKFEKEYTAVMDKDKFYMIKGINDNIDNIFSYKKLPVPVITSIIPFKNNLIYDSMLFEIDIKTGNDFAKIIEKEYSQAIKYYHL